MLQQYSYWYIERPHNQQLRVMTKMMSMITWIIWWWQSVILNSKPLTCRLIHLLLFFYEPVPFKPVIIRSHHSSRTQFVTRFTNTAIKAAVWIKNETKERKTGSVRSQCWTLLCHHTKTELLERTDDDKMPNMSNCTHPQPLMDLVYVLWAPPVIITVACWTVQVRNFEHQY